MTAAIPPAVSYTVRRTRSAVQGSLDWDGNVWEGANVIEIARFHPKSSAHHPVTRAKMLYDDKAVHVLFRVSDQYVRARMQNFQDQVCKDSCVEFFVEPVAGKGYFNFEVNCGGTLLVYYIEDATRVGAASFKRHTVLPREQAAVIKVAHTMPKIVEPERVGPTEWSVQATVPLTVFEHYVGKLGALAGTTWRGNFYKCGDETSHPHWGTWAPIDELNFHLPRCFAPIRFE